MGTKLAACTIRSLRSDGRNGDYKGIILVGHSAAGKSTVARLLGADRKKCDMDVYRLGRKDDIDGMLSQFLTSGEVMLIAANTENILRTMQKHRMRLLMDYAVVYLCRPKDVIRDTLTYINEDGAFHPAISDINKHYDHCDKIYRSIADYILEYPGRSVDELASIVGAVIEEVEKNGRVRVA
ncbi:MAG: hypothetical protein WD005_05910 [Haliea sp.]